MATFHIGFKLGNEVQARAIHPIRDNPPLLESEIAEHPLEISNEIWDLIELELKGQGLSNEHVDRDSVVVIIDTDDDKEIYVPKDIILKCFDR